MLRNYLTVAVRNLVAHRLYSFINIGGLAIGLAACLLILLHVRDELSYDRWLPGAERVAVVESTFTPPGRDKMAFAGAPGPLARPLTQDFGSDIERAVRVFDDQEPVRVGDRQLLGEISYVDPGFFAVFDLPMVAGNRDAALASNASILLSETTARAFFGGAPAPGRSITVSGTKVFTVVGVFADLPRNSHLDLHAIALFDPARYRDQPWVAEEWTSTNMRLYVQFRSPDAMERVAADLPAFVDRHFRFEMPGLTVRPSAIVRFDFLPLLDVHLHGDKPGHTRTGSFAAVVAFAAIAGLILVIACINFVNLATARAMKRAREVAMRKVVGATRAQLIQQHLGEAVLTALLALVVAIAVVELSLPAFNGFLQRDLRLDLLGDPTLAATALGLVILVGALGGLYPAVYLSRFRPAQVLKANQSSVAGSSLLRSGLVVFQFAISITLVVCTATIYCQTVYARTFDLGFEQDDLLVLSGLGDLPSGEAAATLRREVAGLPGVRGAALSTDTPPLRSNNNALLYPTPAPAGDELVIETLTVDPHFLAVYGVEPVAGRLFSSDRTADFRPHSEQVGPGARQSVVVNRAFAAKLGAPRPQDVIGRTLWEASRDGKPMIPTTVVGVVADVHLRSMRTAITPLLYYARAPGEGFNRLTVKVAPERMRETVAAVERIWRRLAPQVPVRTSFVDQDLSAQYDGDAQRGQIFAGFAVFAVLIACLGLFGLASFAAERRTKEIGLRKVLGASVLDIVRLLVWQFSRPVLVANLIAWPVSFYLMSRWLAGFRYAIDLTSLPVLAGIFGGAALLALAIAWLTIAGHAFRVARASPGPALRVE